MVIMTEPGTEKRIDELSKRVDFGFEQTNQRLGRVEDDVRALRTEMRAGFDQGNGEFGKVGGEFTAVRGEMKAGFDDVYREFTALRAEMKAGFDGLQRQMTRFFAGTLGTIVAAVIVNVILSHS